MKNKIYTLLVFIIILSSIKSYTQENYGAFSYLKDISEYEGLPFRFSANIRILKVDEKASARLIIRVDKEDGSGFFENMWENPIQSEEWGNFSIEGIIDSTANQIILGGITQFNGQFYYDDLKLEVKEANNSWKTIYVNDFEGQTIDNQTDTSFLIHNKLFNAQISPDSLLDLNHCLVIVSDSVPNYGMNKKAGAYANVNDIKIYYEVYGEGSALIILHGNGGSISDAASHYPHFLKKGYKIIAIDSRAQGKSSDSEKELNYELMTSDINELLEQLEIDSAFVWGHSDGAIISLLLGINYPDKVDKILAFRPNLISDTTALRPDIYKWIGSEAETAETETQRKLAQMMLDYPNISTNQLHKIEAKVLLMCGDRDGVTLKHMIKMFHNIPRSQLCVIPGATHGATWENQELFWQIADAFFEKPFTMPDTEDWYQE